MSKGVSQKSLRRTIQALLERDLFSIRAPVVRPEDTPVHERTTAFWRGVLASGALAITLDAIWAYFAVAGLVHLGSARAILAFAWLVGTAGIALSTLVWGKRFVYRMRLISAGSALLALALLGVDAWTVHHRPAEVHAINWMDFPTALIDRIADAVDRRVAPRFAELKKGAETSKPAPQES